MTAEEGKRLKIANHRRYFRAFSGKLNFAPPIENSHWFYLNSVPILNGDCDACYVQADGGNGGDNVGVIERWSLPKAAELTPENIDAIKKAVADGNWRENIRANMWVGKAVAPILGLDPELNRRDITQIIRELIFKKVLKSIQGKTKDRKDRRFVVPGDWSAPVAEGKTCASSSNWRRIMERSNARSARVYWVCASYATGANELAHQRVRQCASCAGSYTGQLEQRT